MTGLQPKPGESLSCRECGHRAHEGRCGVELSHRMNPGPTAHCMCGGQAKQDRSLPAAGDERASNPRDPSIMGFVPTQERLREMCREYEAREGICPTCHGMGGSYSGGLIRFFSRNCRTCEGTGRV